MGNREGHQYAVDSPQRQGTVKVQADQAARVGQRDGPVRQVSVDARLGVNDGDFRSTTSNLNVGSGKRSEQEQETLERDKKPNEILGVAEPGASTYKELVTLLLRLAVALSSLTLDGVKACAYFALGVLDFTAELVGGGASVSRDGVDKLVE